jgi:hypothetical protein
MHVVWPLKNKRVPDPTPAEIRERAEAIRANWSNAEKKNRDAYAADVYVVPTIPSRELCAEV